jgi:hypothetical protein
MSVIEVSAGFGAFETKISFRPVSRPKSVRRREELDTSFAHRRSGLGQGTKPLSR